MTKKRILIAHPRVTASGGGNAVAAWALQALRNCCDLSLATLESVDHDALNRSWGTTLRADDFRVHLAPAPYRQLLRSFPTRGALLETCLTVRLAQNLDRRHHFDIVFSTQNEADFGRRGIHYVHHPWVYLPRPKDELRPYHYIPGLLHAYRLSCRRISRGTNEGLRRNLAIANSSFIAGRIREAHCVDPIILFPPVTGDFADTPWDQRESAFVAVGRIASCKRWERAVAIVDELRQRGHDLALTLIGHAEEIEYQQHLERLAATRPWFRIRLNLTRSELKTAVPSHRYGIHTMEDEHFGMAPAEILRAGCLLFAHNSGGPVEIVGGESRLLFDDTTQAVDKIARVLSSPALEAELRAQLEARRRLFTTEMFCRGLREIIDRFE